MTERSDQQKDGIRKIRIVSNNMCYGPCPEPDEEIEQRLTITNSGRVWLTSYNYCHDGINCLTRMRTKIFKIDSQDACKILESIAMYFAGNYVTVYATDIGSWKLTITSTDEKPIMYCGSLCAKFTIDGVDLSDLIRDTLKMPDLFIFDGGQIKWQYLSIDTISREFRNCSTVIEEVMR